MGIFLRLVSKTFPAVLLLLLSEHVSAQNGASFNSSGNLLFSIETSSLNDFKPVDTLDILLETSGYPIAGVELKIGFDSYAVEILEILRGELPDSCAWEYFDTKASIDQGKEGYPRSIWQVVMLADFMPDSVRPNCHCFNRTVSVAQLVVMVDSSRSRGFSDSLLPIYFFWEDCTDNTVTNVSGDSLMMSLVVDGVSSAGHSWAESTKIQPPVTTPAGDISFPSRLGVPDACINPKAKNKPTRRLIFQSGGVRVGTVVDNEKSDQ